MDGEAAARLLMAPKHKESIISQFGDRAPVCGRGRLALIGNERKRAVLQRAAGVALRRNGATSMRRGLAARREGSEARSLTSACR